MYLLSFNLIKRSYEFVNSSLSTCIISILSKSSGFFSYSPTKQYTTSVSNGLEKSLPSIYQLSIVKGGDNTTEFDTNIHFKLLATSFPSILNKYLINTYDLKGMFG